MLLGAWSRARMVASCLSGAAAPPACSARSTATSVEKLNAAASAYLEHVLDAQVIVGTKEDG